MTIPAKLQTYLMTGIPILGMLDGEGAKIIEESNSGLCSPASDSASLARLATRMSQFSHEKNIQLGHNGIEYSKKEFDRSILMNKLENFFIAAVQHYRNNN